MAHAHHNLGMISADMRRWEDAEHYYAQSLDIAVALGDEHHRAQCLLLAGRGAQEKLVRTDHPWRLRSRRRASRRLVWVSPT